MSDVSIEKAEAYFKSQENIKALSMLKRLIENDPNDIAALMMSALIYKNLAKFSKAIKLLNKIIALKPDHTGALYNLGLNYSIIEENDRAIEIYSELFKTNPELTDLPIKLANLYNKTMQYDKAIECIEKYVDYTPSDSIAWFELGFSYKTFCLLSIEAVVSILIGGRPLPYGYPISFKIFSAFALLYVVYGFT